MAPLTFRLISRSTTTGWWDWEHGELWLGSRGLLRRRRGWSQTFASSGLVQDVFAHDTDPSMQQRFTEEAIDRIVEQGGRSIPSDAIKAAQLRAGVMTGRLRLELEDGQSIKFLWAKSNLTYGALRTEFTRWLGDVLVLD